MRQAHEDAVSGLFDRLLKTVWLTTGSLHGTANFLHGTTDSLVPTHLCWGPGALLVTCTGGAVKCSFYHPVTGEQPAKFANFKAH